MHTSPTNQRSQSTTTIPIIKLNPDEIWVVELAVNTHLAHTRKLVKPSAQRDREINAIDQVLSLLAAMRQGQPHICLTIPDIQTLDRSLAGYIHLICQRIPPSAERDDTLSGFAKLRHDLATMLETHCIQSNIVL